MIIVIFELFLKKFAKTSIFEHFFLNHQTESAKKFYINKNPLWLCFSKCKNKKFDTDILMKYKKNYVARIKQLHGTKKNNFLKGKYKKNLLSENLLKKYSAECQHHCKPVKYSKNNWKKLQNINPGIWKTKGDKPSIKNFVNDPSNLILCKAKCTLSNDKFTSLDSFIKKMMTDNYIPSIFRTNKNLRWGKYNPFPEIFNTNFKKNDKILKCKDYCMPFKYTKEFVNYIKKQEKNKIIWDQEIYSPRKTDKKGVLRTD